MEFLVALLVGAAGSLLAAEIYVNCPRVGGWLINRAVHMLPEQERARYQEEWRAHFDDLPGALSKFGHALGCVWAARGVAKLTRPTDWILLAKRMKWILRWKMARLMFADAARGDFAGIKSTWSMINRLVGAIKNHLVSARDRNLSDRAALDEVLASLTSVTSELERELAEGSHSRPENQTLPH